MAAVARIPDSAPVMSPVVLRERIDVVDILRAFAVFGMLVVNFSHDLEWRWLFTKLWPGTPDRVAYFLLHFLAAMKFHSLFSFLFGWGFALQMERAEARGVRFFPLYARRIFVLLLIGLANWVLLDWDSTLVEYALAGYLLFLFRGRSLKAVLVAVLLCLCYWPVRDAFVIYGHAHQIADPRTAAAVRQADAKAEAEEVARQEENVQIHMHRSFKEIIRYDAREDVATSLSSADFYFGLLGYPFPLLLLGLYAGRRRILHDVPAHLAFIRKVFWWGLSLGLLGNAVGVLVSPYPGTYRAPWDKSLLGNLVFYQIGIPALCLCYASAIPLLVQKPAWKLRLLLFAPVGRMALSNYLVHAVIYKTLAYGLGFYARFGPLLGLVVGVDVFLLLALLSAWWTKRFRFGPVEWLWRTLTYGKLQPIRAAAPAVVPGA